MCVRVRARMFACAPHVTEESNCPVSLQYVLPFTSGATGDLASLACPWKVFAIAQGRLSINFGRQTPFIVWYITVV